MTDIEKRDYQESIAQQRRELAELLDDTATRVRSGAPMPEIVSLISNALDEADSIYRQT